MTATDRSSSSKGRQGPTSPSCSAPMGSRCASVGVGVGVAAAVVSASGVDSRVVKAEPRPPGMAAVAMAAATAAVMVAAASSVTAATRSGPRTH